MRGGRSPTSGKQRTYGPLLRICGKYGLSRVPEEGGGSRGRDEKYHVAGQNKRGEPTEPHPIPKVLKK